ncbi:glycine zipper 2TM domain-containing protein [Thiohalobacter sp.]|uniref:glycine zipper 2TM domain-containing protein n=1 Tax=Thiohalobacter sp. TaxID=2025948 RepID=UPI00261C4844|nr:hypothetical protein [Thiohalobacter sp.]
MKYAIPAVLGLALVAAGPVCAVDTDAAIGGAVGGAVVGSELGGRDGAIAGAAVGAAVGTAVATSDEASGGSAGSRVEVGVGGKGGPPAHAWRTPPGHVKNGKPHKWK